MINEKTIKITDATETSTWYLDTEGDLFETKKEASLMGVDKVIIADNWYPGSVEDWKKTIKAKI